MEPPCCAIGEATDLGRSKPTTLINCIRALRFVADEMTQAELAREVGVTRQTIIAIEKGKYAPSLEVAFRIAHVFGKTVDQVFEYDAAESLTDS